MLQIIKRSVSLLTVCAMSLLGGAFGALLVVFSMRIAAIDISSSLSASIIGGLIAGFMALIAVIISHKLESNSTLKREANKIKHQKTQFIAELGANKKMISAKLKALNELINTNWQLKDDSPFFDNPHFSSASFIAIRPHLIDEYDNMFYTRLHSLYDELKRLDKKVDQFDDIFLSKEWKTNPTVSSVGKSLVRHSKLSYDKISTELNSILTEILAENKG